MIKCNRDCFNCSFHDCIVDEITPKERKMINGEDTDIKHERGERFYSREHERKRNYEYYHGIRIPQRPLKRKVVQKLQDGTVIGFFDSLKEAASSIGVKNTQGIQMVCAKRRHTAYGYGWEYAD